MTTTINTPPPTPPPPLKPAQNEVLTPWGTWPSIASRWAGSAPHCAQTPPSAGFLGGAPPSAGFTAPSAPSPLIGLAGRASPLSWGQMSGGADGGCFCSLGRGCAPLRANPPKRWVSGGSAPQRWVYCPQRPQPPHWACWEGQPTQLGPNGWGGCFPQCLTMGMSEFWFPLAA